MSKIFEAMKILEAGGAGTFVPGLIDPTVDGMSVPSESDGVPVPEPVALTEPVHADTAPPALCPMAELDTSLVRSLPLRVPSGLPVLPFDNTNWSASEQYRIVRTRIIQHPGSPHMIVTSSPGPGDGKSVTTINVAGALSLKTAARVLLLDADFRRASIHFQLGLPEKPGLAEVLEGKCRFEDALIHAQQLPNLYILPAGGRVANPAELLDSPRWVALCATLRREFEYVIVDSPPIAAVADYDLIQAACDGVIMVVRPDHTNRKACFKAIERVPKSKLIGVLLNCVGNWFLTKSYYYPEYYGRDGK